MGNKRQQVRKISEAKQPSGSKRAQGVAQKSEAELKRSRQISGLLSIFAGVVLFILAIMPNIQGAVSRFVGSWIHSCFGIFSYILPFFLIAIGISLFIVNNTDFNRKNFIIGLSVFALGFITFISCMAPISTNSVEDPNLLFSDKNLIAYGGYFGNGVAFALISLFGKVITVVICIFVMAVGLLIGGFSGSSFKAKFMSFFKRDDEAHDDGTEVYDQKKIKFDKNGDIDPSCFEEFELGKKTSVLSKWQDKMKEEGVEPKSKVRSINNNPRQIEKEIQTEQIEATSESDFELPPFDLLEEPKKTSKSKDSEKILAMTAQNLQRTLEEFGVMARVVGWVAGPTVTLFKVELPAGVRVNKVQNLGTDVALALATASVRIFAPIPGTNYVGIEVPNKTRETVVLSEVLRDAGKGSLQIAIGKDVEGKSVVCDLAKMPHLLIGGTTGSGKSVSVNAMIMSILMRATPEDVRLIMIDPKRVEFTPYNGIPHLYVPVVTEAREAASALSWGVAEMERRLKLMSEVSARNITEYNAKVNSGALDDLTKTPSDGEVPEKKHIHLPYIVIIIDELADLMMAVGKEVEMSICRLAQLARAAGIHLIVATQRPSTNVVTGLIKSNITNRIAFNVASSIDSRVILDTTGAEDLIGLGDLLLSKPELGKPMRIQGCFVSEKEITNVVDFIKEQGEPEYNNEILSTNIMGIGDTNPSPSGAGADDDPLVWEAAEIVISTGLGSTSNLQRRLKVGYSRAGRIMDQLEEKGIVGSANGSKPREVLIDALELETLKVLEAND